MTKQKQPKPIDHSEAIRSVIISAMNCDATLRAFKLYVHEVRLGEAVRADYRRAIPETEKRIRQLRASLKHLKAEQLKLTKYQESKTQ